jgi:hypothetical protein
MNRNWIVHVRSVEATLIGGFILEGCLDGVSESSG